MTPRPNGCSSADSSKVARGLTCVRIVNLARLAVPNVCSVLPSPRSPVGTAGRSSTDSKTGSPMSNLLAIVAIGLLIAAVPASVSPVLPGTVLTLLGLVVHWFGVGTINTPVMLSLIVLVVVVMALDAVAGVLAARAGGASWWTGAAGAAVGMVLVVAIGPVGLLVGFAVTVLGIELARGRSFEASLRTTGYTMAATLGSKIAQVGFALFVAGVVIVLTLV